MGLGLRGLRPALQVCVTDKAPGFPDQIFAEGFFVPMPNPGTVSGCAADTFDFWKIEPEVAAVIVFAEDDFTIGAGDCVAELVAVAAVLENGGGDAEIGYVARDDVAAEQIGHFLSAETEEPAVGDQRYGSDWGEMRSSECMEALVLVEREQPPNGVGSEQQATMGIARPAKRAGPVAFGKLHGGAANPARSNVEAPESRAII